MMAWNEKIKQTKVGYYWHKWRAMPFMPVIWYTCFCVLVWFLCTLLQIPKQWRIGLVFWLLNSVVAYRIGRLIVKRHLTSWWVLLLPVIFAMAVAIHFAKYNFLLSAVYLILSLLGTWQDTFYREKV